MSRIRLALSGLAAACALLATGCLGSARMETTRPAGNVLSPKLNPFIYHEDGAVLFLAVDVRAAQFVKDAEQTMFPLGIGLVNRSAGSVTLNRESFVLETEQGRRYPLVSIQEYNRDYNRSGSDRQLADQFLEILTRRYGTFEFVNRPFFPYRGSATTAADSFELGVMHWTHQYLYFPIPESGLHGQRFKLLVATREKPGPFVVDFKLP